MLVRSNALNTIRTYTQKPIAVNPDALLKQSKSSHLHKNGTRNYSSPSSSPAKTSTGPKYDRSSFPSSRTSQAISQKGAAPFASTLRPNLTGGTLSRSAGGYSLGGAGRARQFSHTSGCQAQVVQNVSAGIRAFLINGSKARYDGVDSVTGEKRWKAVTKAQDTVLQKWEAANAHHSGSPKGTSLEFQLSPTITAILPFQPSESTLPSSVGEKTINLNSPHLLQTLSSDFARALRDFALITHDLNKLSSFGDLPISLSTNTQGPLLRVRFPGCDANAVSALCDEAGIRRGMIIEDPAWTESRDVEMALLFPFAPTDGSEADSEEEEDVRGFFSPKALSPHQQLQLQRARNVPERNRTRSFSTTTSLYDLSPSSGSELSTLHFDELPALSTPDVFDESPSEFYVEEEEENSSASPSSRSHPAQARADSPAASAPSHEDFEGVEGIYRFLSAIEDARGRPLR